MVLRKHAIYIVTIRCTSREGGRSLIEDIVDPRSSSSKEASSRENIYIYIYIYIYIFGNRHLYQLLRRDYYYTRSRLEATSKNISLLPRYLVHYFIPSLFIRTQNVFIVLQKEDKKKNIYVQRQIASSNA